jgi:hypothetical protein
MSTVEKHYGKYTVLKNEDLERFFAEFSFDGESDLFQKVLDRVREMRVKDGRRGSPRYIVCNADEPYSEEVWQTILDGEREKNG